MINQRLKLETDENGNRTGNIVKDDGSLFLGWGQNYNSAYGSTFTNSNINNIPKIFTVIEAGGSSLINLNNYTSPGFALDSGGNFDGQPKYEYSGNYFKVSEILNNYSANNLLAANDAVVVSNVSSTYDKTYTIYNVDKNANTFYTTAGSKDWEAKGTGTTVSGSNVLTVTTEDLSTNLLTYGQNVVGIADLVAFGSLYYWQVYTDGPHNLSVNDSVTFSGIATVGGTTDYDYDGTYTVNYITGSNSFQIWVVPYGTQGSYIEGRSGSGGTIDNHQWSGYSEVGGSPGWFKFSGNEVFYHSPGSTTPLTHSLGGLDNPLLYNDFYYIEVDFGNVFAGQIKVDLGGSTSGFFNPLGSTFRIGIFELSAGAGGQFTITPTSDFDGTITCVVKRYDKFGTFKVGQWIRGDGIPSGTKINSINKNIITMSNNATKDSDNSVGFACWSANTTGTPTAGNGLIAKQSKEAEFAILQKNKYNIIRYSRDLFRFLPDDNELAILNDPSNVSYISTMSNFVNNFGTYIRISELNILQNILDLGAKYDVYVVPSLANRWYGESEPNWLAWASEETRWGTEANLWAEVAKRFGGHPGIAWYSLISEPRDSSISSVRVTGFNSATKTLTFSNTVSSMIGNTKHIVVTKYENSRWKTEFFELNSATNSSTGNTVTYATRNPSYAYTSDPITNLTSSWTNPYSNTTITGAYATAVYDSSTGSNYSFPWVGKSDLGNGGYYNPVATISTRDRSPSTIARSWVNKMKTAIRSQDKNTMITLGSLPGQVVPTSFNPSNLNDYLDLFSPHIYIGYTNKDVNSVITECEGYFTSPTDGKGPKPLFLEEGMAFLDSSGIGYGQSPRPTINFLLKLKKQFVGGLSKSSNEGFGWSLFKTGRYGSDAFGWLYLLDFVKSFMQDTPSDDTAATVTTDLTTNIRNRKGRRYLVPIEDSNTSLLYVDDANGRTFTTPISNLTVKTVANSADATLSNTTNLIGGMTYLISASTIPPFVTFTTPSTPSTSIKLSTSKGVTSSGTSFIPATIRAVNIKSSDSYTTSGTTEYHNSDDDSNRPEYINQIALGKEYGRRNIAMDTSYISQTQLIQSGFNMPPYASKIYLKTNTSSYSSPYTPLIMNLNSFPIASNQSINGVKLISYFQKKTSQSVSQNIEIGARSVPTAWVTNWKGIPNNANYNANIKINAATVSSTTITITTSTSHNLTTGQSLAFTGFANGSGGSGWINLNSGGYQITVTGSTTFTFTASGISGASSVTNAYVRNIFNITTNYPTVPTSTSSFYTNGVQGYYAKANSLLSYSPYIEWSLDASGFSNATTQSFSSLTVYAFLNLIQNFTTDKDIQRVNISLIDGSDGGLIQTILTSYCGKFVSRYPLGLSGYNADDIVYYPGSSPAPAGLYKSKVNNNLNSPLYNYGLSTSTWSLVGSDLSGGASYMLDSKGAWFKVSAKYSSLATSLASNVRVRVELVSSTASPSNADASLTINRLYAIGTIGGGLTKSFNYKIASVSASGTAYTYTTSETHGIERGMTVAISNVINASINQSLPDYNGTFVVSSVGTNTFTVTGSVSKSETIASASGAIAVQLSEIQLLKPSTTTVQGSTAFVNTTNYFVTAANASGTTYTFNTFWGHPFKSGDKVVISGLSINAYNNKFTIVSVPTGNSFTVTGSISNPGNLSSAFGNCFADVDTYGVFGWNSGASANTTFNQTDLDGATLKWIPNVASYSAVDDPSNLSLYTTYVEINVTESISPIGSKVITIV